MLILNIGMHNSSSTNIKDSINFGKWKLTLLLYQEHKTDDQTILKSHSQHLHSNYKYASRMISNKINDQLLHGSMAKEMVGSLKCSSRITSK